ncbi:hypothetical protein [Chryseobacterium indologenes]|uniref:Uncharacterized protein n=1 Tax=Chryseobacterium indologenes TaxID=253 RepID=A0A0N0ZVG5_CHRID|nr:hypothetical protein [Chryseobacterium indologenes]KPE48955.1 hypothetical protein AOB46_22610 [Chryseobacterium indologenes]
MVINMLKNNLSKNIILYLICVFLLSCNKEQKTEVLNKEANQLTFESFIPFVVKDKKYRVLPSMSEIFEAGKVQFTNKIELPNEFLKTPLWEISW